MRTARIVIASLLLPLVARAAAPEVIEDLDGDGKKERIALDATGALRVATEGGAEWGAVKPPANAGALGEGKIEVTRAKGRIYIHARIALAGGRAVEEVAIVDGNQVREVASFVAGPEGPDGERSLALRIDAEGAVRYQTAPRVARCDGYDVLFPELYDVASGKFRAVSIAPPHGEDVEATQALPAIAKEPPLGLFRFTAASTQRGDERRADRLAPPRELDDGNLDTAWYEGALGSGRGAFVTARSIAGPQALAGIAIATAPGNRLTSLALFAGGAPLHVELEGAKRGERWWWIPLAGRRAECVSVALDGIERSGRGDDSGIAEVRVYTEVDGPGGVARLLEQVERGASGVDALLPLLGEHASEVAKALPAAAPAGRRLLLRALATSAKPEAAAALVAALPTANEGDRGLIVEALAPGRPLASPAREPLAHLVGERSVPVAARLAALDLLGRLGGGAKQVWAALEAGALDEAALREGAVRAVAAAPVEEALAALAAGDAAKEAVARVRVLGALAGRADSKAAAPQRERAIEMLLALAPPDAATGDDFALRFHWLRAARLATSARLLPAIAREAASKDETLRWAAVEAAAALDGGAGVDVVRRALGDRDPRVRAAALSGLGALHDTSIVAASEKSLRNDRWPMVRKAAAERLAASCPATSSAALAHAVDDRDDGVAVAALSSLAKCDAAQAGPLALRVAANMKARIAVREHATALVAQLRPPASAATLSEALMDVLDYPGTDERSAGLMTSMARAIGKLGDPAGEPGLQRALGEPLLPALRATAIESLAALCTEGAKRSIAAAAQDADPALRRAAAAVAPRCK